MRLQRLRNLNPAVATLALSLWLVIACNAPFWRALSRITGGLSTASLPVFAVAFVFAVLLINFLLTALAFRWIAKPLLILVLAASAATTYFMDSYGVMIDRVMLQNILESNPQEAGELLSWRLGAYVALLAAVPAAWLAWSDLAHPRWWKALLQQGAVLAASLACIGVLMFLFYKDFASIVRNHGEVRYLLTPANYVGALQGYLKARNRAPRSLVRVGEDARKGPRWQAPGKRTLTVIVVGETARAANFSLGGYPRKTNPQLEKEDIVYFSNVMSCGTSTAASLPCMFSDLGRDAFDAGRAANREGLFDVLAHAGFAVWWLDNNSGCKGNCDRIATEDFSRPRPSEFCRTDECYDEILVEGLRERLKRADRDLVVVLHQKGSHGPAYYLRYPEGFGVFRPACGSNELGRCSRAEIVNAFDNTILYTDHVLAKTIRLMKENAGAFDAAMLFVSDHGESLGENGIYLHGLPYAIAPIEQKHVPMLVWFAEGLRERFAIDAACVSSKRHQAYAHDHLFHSVLGLLDIETKAYRPELDIFRTCRHR